MPPPPNMSARLDYSPSSARAWAAGWDYAKARAAVDAHLRGNFVASYQLAIDLNRHPAALAARRQRRSAITALPWILRGPERAPQRYETEDAARTWGMVQPLLGEITDDIAVMGFAVLEHPLEVVDTDTGPRYVVTEVRQWPLSCVEHGSAILARDGSGPYEPDRYYARLGTPDPATGRIYIPLPEPGETDGHFTVIGEKGAPHRRGAIIACDLEYVAAQLGRRAWAKLLVALGKASIIGELPPELQTGEGAGGDHQKIADAFQAMLEAVGDSQVAGIRPAGSKTDVVQVTASTATLLPDSIDASVRMFALAILGHDAGLSRGENVYNDPKSQTIPEDLNRDTARTIVTGVEALLNFVASLNCEKCAKITLDPQIPDSDQDMRREAVQARRKADDEHRKAQAELRKAVAEALAAEKAAGVLVDETHAAKAYAEAGLEAPRLRPPPIAQNLATIAPANGVAAPAASAPPAAS